MSGPTSRSTTMPTPTSARPASSCASARRPIARHAPWSMKTACCATAPVSSTETLRAEAAVLPERTRPHDSALHPEGRPRHGARHRRNRRLRHLMSRAEEGRNVVRAPQTHPEARSAAPARPNGARDKFLLAATRPKPPQARQADPADTPGYDRLRGDGPSATVRPTPSAPPPADFFNTIRHQPPFGLARISDITRAGGRRNSRAPELQTGHPTALLRPESCQKTGRDESRSYSELKCALNFGLLAAGQNACPIRCERTRAWDG